MGGAGKDGEKAHGEKITSFSDWLKYAEPIAYQIGSHPAEFEEMQPGEFLLFLKGFEDRRKDEDFRRSYFTAMLMNPHLEKPISPQTIFNPLYYSPDEIKKMQDEKKQADIEYFKRFNQ